MFKVYKASAGSGKTTSLVAEYLSLCLLNPKKFKHILAVTFTNNATAEMKERIIKTLQAFAFASPDTLTGSNKAIYNILKKDIRFQQLDSEAFQLKASVLLREILYDYPNFSISTIDSFFQRIIRSFAFDLGINMNYNVEIDLNDCYNQTVDILLNKLSKDDASLSNRVLRLVDKQMEEKGKWKLEKFLKKELATIYNEKAFEPAKALGELYQRKIMIDGRESNSLEEIVLDLNSLKDVKVKTLKTAVEKLTQLLMSLGDDPSLFIQGSKGVWGWVKALAENPQKTPGSLVKKAIDAESVLKKPSVEDKQLQPAIVDAYNMVLEAQLDLCDVGVVTKYSSSLLLLFDLKNIMDDIKLRDNLFFLNEANGRIFDEIKDVDTPYIYEKIGNKYSYFFIDEFQDTSKMQWEDFKPLIKNALSGINQFNESGDTILFGDVKQSIYRFRNGDSSLLNQLSSYEGLRLNFQYDLVEKKDFKLIPLDTNYRSSKAVIEFNNQFFKYLCKNHFSGNELLNHYYEDVEQHIPSQKDGYVYVRFETEEDTDEYLQVETLNAINDALARNYNYSDIAVLSKANATCSSIANYLSQNNIPVISSDSLLLGSSAEVLLIINTLKYLLTPEDKLVQLSIAEYFCKDNLNEAIELISKAGGFTRFINTLKDWIDIDKLQDTNLLLSSPVFTIVKELLLVYRLSEADAYILAFMDAVYENFNARFSDLTQFLQWWEEKGRMLSITSSKENDAVTVMSIHKSKGLQFPVVIYPMRNYKRSNGMETAWVKDDELRFKLPYFRVNTSKSALEGSHFAPIAVEEADMTSIDNINVIYVAHTRAADALYIITGNPEQRNGNYPKFLNGFIKSLDKNETQYIAPSPTGTEKPVETERAPSPLKEFWFGNKDFTNQKTAVETGYGVSRQQGIEHLYSSDFTLRSEQLLCGSRRSEKQELGVFIHEFLSKLQVFPQNEEELSEMLSAIENTDDRRILGVAMLEIMNDPGLKPYFAPGVTVLNETSILLPNGQLRRPDRIVFLDDEVMVIDYKTGKENDDYQKQLDEYCALLEQMGYKNVHSRLIYL